MDEITEFLTTIYFLLVAMFVTAEHFTFGRWLKHNEYARRAIGIVTVTGLAAPFVFLDAWPNSQMTFLILCGGFLAAAGTKMLFVSIEKEQHRQKEIELNRIFDDETSV